MAAVAKKMPLLNIFPQDPQPLPALCALAVPNPPGLNAAVTLQAPQPWECFSYSCDLIFSYDRKVLRPSDATG